MKTVLTWLLLAALPCFAGGGPEAAVLMAPGRTVRVDDRPGVTELRASLAGIDQAAELTITWPGAAGARNFERTPAADGLVRSTCRIGTATVTRTVLLDAGTGTVFLHVHADQPGVVDLLVKPGGGGTIEDRRQLVSPEGALPPSHVWVLPFESDVAPEDGAIRLRGEGEALILWAFGPAGSAENLAETYRRFAARHDPGEPHPNPSRIWKGVLEAHRARTEARK